jgi:hypothetical protein
MGYERKKIENMTTNTKQWWQLFCNGDPKTKMGKS